MIKQNFLPKTFANDLEQFICSNTFYWNFNDSITYSDKDSFSKKDFQLTHNFVRNSEITSNFFEQIKPIVYIFEEQSGFVVKSIRRIKANLMVNQELNEYELNQLIHIDCDEKTNSQFISLVYYVMNSDGDTILFDENKNPCEICSPVKNTAIWFNSKQLHRPTPPKINKKRIVLNFVFEVE